MRSTGYALPSKNAIEPDLRRGPQPGAAPGRARIRRGLWIVLEGPAPIVRVFANDSAECTRLAPLAAMIERVLRAAWRWAA